MPAFFAHSRGTMVRVTSQWRNGGGVIPFRILIAGTDLADPNTDAIITNGGIVEHGNYQFMHTVSETIYAYVFGDRIGELRVGGVCFASTCGSEVSGIQRIVKAYRRNRIGKAGSEVQVSFGEIDFKAFLTSMSLEIADAELNIGQWVFTFNTFPGNADG